MLGEEWKDPVDITQQQWVNLLEDRAIVRESDLHLLKALYRCKNYRATAKQLAQLLHVPHHITLNLQVGQLGKRIAKELPISVPKHKHGKGRDKEPSWWNVPFWGETQKEGEYWILRPELQAAIQEVIDKEVFLLDVPLAEEIGSSDQKNLYEGAKKQIYVNSYERDRNARNQCINEYGVQCCICEFDFEKTYGPVGRDFIHVHHLIPLSKIKETYQVKPLEDLRPVCPNCHAIIHKKNPPYSIDEVRAMMRNARME